MNTPDQISPIVDAPPVSAVDLSDCHHRWFLVDGDGKWAGDGVAKKLDQLTLSVAHGHLVVRAPGMLRLDIPIDVIEDDESVWAMVDVAGQSVNVVDEGDLVAAWFANVVGQPVRLVKRLPDQDSPMFG